MAIGAAGTIIAAGWSTVARYRDDGRLNWEFGVDGVMRVGRHINEVSAISSDAKGEPLLAGARRTRHDHTDFALARLPNVPHERANETG